MWPKQGAICISPTYEKGNLPQSHRGKFQGKFPEFTPETFRPKLKESETGLRDSYENLGKKLSNRNLTPARECPCVLLLSRNTWCRDIEAEMHTGSHYWKELEETAHSQVR